MLFILSGAWIYKTYRKERIYVRQMASQSSQVRVSAALTSSIAAHQSKIAGKLEVTIKPEGKRILATPGCTLLELAERNGLQLETGCRMGVCGADPVSIIDGMNNLSKIGSDEQSTLDRLGLAENTRMACCARVKGPVTMALKPEKPRVSRSSAIAGFNYDPYIRNVVIIGNGIAGITAADHIRRRHPSCQIYVIGREKHHLYNRMGLARLIYGRSAMQGLYLNPDTWYDEHQITCWLNTQVTTIDPQTSTLRLADGESLPYDRLILATGSSSTIPPIPNYGIPGTFVLREADDAMHIRQFAQQNNSKHAIVAGGGLLGLEAAYALHKLGLSVTVLERSRWPMRRQLDERGGYFLQQYLAALGITVMVDAETAALQGEQRVEMVALKDQRTLPCDVFLVCAGIKPNIVLAVQAGITHKNGILVDDHMRTNIPNIYAVGDVAEYGGQVYGLWPVAVDQATVAAINAIGGDKTYLEKPPSTMLKVAGIDLMSIGRIEPESAYDEVIVFEDAETYHYRKLIISDGKIVGAILLGYTLEIPLVSAAIKEGRNVEPILNELRAENWAVLGDTSDLPAETIRPSQALYLTH